MNELGVAVIGLGIGRRHIEAYQKVPGVSVVAIAGTTEATLAETQQACNIPVTSTDFRAAIARDDVDLVSICTPDRRHAEQALFALEAGKHVLCEKPMVTNLEDAARVVEEVRRTERTFMVGHNYRFFPQFEKVKALVDAGTLGPLFLGESSYIQDLYFMEELGPAYWRIKDPQDFYLGGAVHNVDLLRWILGEIEEVHAFSNRMMAFYPIDENYVSNFRFTNGHIGRVLLTLGARLKEKFRVDLNVYGYEGTLRASLQHNDVLMNVDKAEGGQPAVLPTEDANSFEREIAHFVACVREGRQPLVDAVEGAKAVAVCIATIRSAMEGKPVTVDYSFLPK